jgi:hypothetical protein
MRLGRALGNRRSRGGGGGVGYSRPLSRALLQQAWKNTTLHDSTVFCFSLTYTLGGVRGDRDTQGGWIVRASTDHCPEHFYSEYWTISFFTTLPSSVWSATLDHRLIEVELPSQVFAEYRRMDPPFSMIRPAEG